MADPIEAWQAGLPDELRFWDDWLGGRTAYNDDRDLRLTPGREIPAWMAEKLDPDLAEPQVLDVGAGPLTAMGTRWGEKPVQIKAVDPLANGYNEILERSELDAPVKTEFGLGEELTLRFGRDRFDFAYACNCLDHAQSPVECYRQMLAVLKPGAWLMTWHEAEEAVHQNWAGLHQWNFVVRWDRLKVYNRTTNFDVVDLCPDAAEFFLETDRKYIKFGMRKRREGEPSATVAAPLAESLPEPFLSVHVPKTAGSAFRRTLEQWYGEGLLPIYHWIPRNEDRTAFSDEERAARCIHGHFTEDRFNRLDARRPRITWLRDPVQRMVSSYFQILRHPEPDKTHGFDGEVVDERWSLQRYARHPWVQRQVHDYLRGRSLAHFHFVGISEEYDLSMRVIAKLLGRELPETDDPTLNVNPNRVTPSYQFSPALEAELKALFYDEYVLWQQARERLYRQAEALGVA